jgi:hypothetical protein
VVVENDLDLVGEPCPAGGVIAFGLEQCDRAAQHVRQRLETHAGRLSRLQIPALGAGGVKVADIGELGIQGADQGGDFIWLQGQFARAFEDQCVTCKGERDRIGAQRVGVCFARHVVTHPT